MLALQRSAGNAAVGGMLQRSRVLARERSKESMDAAYREFGKRVGSADVFAFIVRLRSAGSMPDGAGTFTWQDFVAVIGSDTGKKWIKDKWRDQEGARWGDQFIQGQHEWIKTEDVTYVIRTVVSSHAGANLDAWLSALESLRIPTADAAFKPKVEPKQIDNANWRPQAFTATSLGSFSGHIGAFYAPRDTPHPEDPVRFANAPQTTGEKDDFHRPLERLLRRHLSADKNNLPAFLTALRKFQTDKLWGGDIEGLESRGGRAHPQRLPCQAGCRRATAWPLHVHLRAGRGDQDDLPGGGDGRRPAVLRPRGQAAQRADHGPPDQRDPVADQAQGHSGAALELPPVGAHRGAMDPGSGRQVRRRLRPGGRLRTSQLDPIGTGGDMQIEDDKKPDEVYTQDTRQPEPEPASETFDQEQGQQRSGVTQQLEQRFNTINLEVQRAIAETMRVASTQLEAQVNGTLASTPPEQHEAIVKWAHEERAAIQARYTERARAPYDKCMAGKRLLDLQLFEQEPRQTTVTAQRKLLKDYFAAVNALLDVYVAELKAALAT